MLIHIRNLKTETLIGAYPAERKAKRKVVINLSVDYEAGTALSTDKLEDSLDYDAIEKAIQASVPKQKFVLLESLAAHVAHLVLAMERVREVLVVVEKPGALESADSVAAEYRLRK